MNTAKPPLEKKVVKQILVYLRSVGAYAVKNHGSPLATRGQLDLSCCYKGYYLAFEVKRDFSGKPTLLQTFNIRQIRKAGGIAGVVWSVGQVRKVIQSLDQKP